MKGGVETAGVMAFESWAVHSPFSEHAVFGGEGRGPGESEVSRLLTKGGKPVRLARPCPSHGEVLPCNKDVR